MLQLLLQLGFILPVQHKIIHIFAYVELAVYATVAISQDVPEGRAVTHSLGCDRE